MNIFALAPEPVLLANTKLFKPKQIQTAISPNTFTAQDARNYSNAEFIIFWDRVLFTKQYSFPIQSYDFLASSALHPENYRSSKENDNPYNVLRISSS